MKFFEQQYYEALNSVLKDGLMRPNRSTGETLTMQAPAQFVINLPIEGLPLLRGKRMFPKKPLVEAVWILSGRNDIAFLNKHGVNYWNLFDKGDGTIGNSYGPRIRNFEGVDQLTTLIDNIKNNKYSRRLDLTFTHPAITDGITPCYSYLQFRVIAGYINLYVTQRSGDAFLGVPNDVLVFSYILGFVAYMTGYFVGSIYYTVNDFHIYANHLDPVSKYFKQYMGWRLMFKRVAGYFSYDFTQYNGDNPDIDDTLQTIIDLNFDIVYNFDKYISNPFIKAEVTV